MTLVELMLVMVIISLAATGTMVSVNALARTKLRAAAMRVAAAARFARHRALTQGKTVRVVLDLDQGTLGIEEASGRVTLTRATDDDEEPEVVDPWEAAQAIMDHPDEPTLGATAFGAICDEDGDPISRFTEQPFDGNIRITRFISPHETEPRERGRVAFYYFPNGSGEHTYVELQDPRENRLTVEIDGLSARASVSSERIDPRDVAEKQPRDPR